jgi:hypothetical protein
MCNGRWGKFDELLQEMQSRNSGSTMNDCEFTLEQCKKRHSLKEAQKTQKTIITCDL